MKNIPNKLFLVIGDDAEDIDNFNNLDHEYVCWSKQRTDVSDIEYVHISDRDKFAIEFAEWLKHGQYESAESDNGVHEYVNIWDNKSESFTISELLQLFHSQKQTQG
jgi:hypothetical protein